MSKNTHCKNIFMLFFKYSILIIVAVLSGCSTPYLEQGFKSEADFAFAKKFQLTPAEVEFAKASKLRAWDVTGLRQHNITSKNSYDFIINEMQTSGFSKKFPNADIFDYLYWRPEAIKNKITVLEQISYHNNMVKKEKEDIKINALTQDFKKIVAEFDKNLSERKYFLACKSSERLKDFNENTNSYPSSFRNDIQIFSNKIKTTCERVAPSLKEANKLVEVAKKEEKIKNYARACDILVQASTMTERSNEAIEKFRTNMCVAELWRLNYIVNSSSCKAIFSARNSCALVAGSSNYSPCMRIRYGSSYTSDLESQCTSAEKDRSNSQFMREFNEACNADFSCRLMSK